MNDNRQLPHSKKLENQALTLVPRFTNFEETFDAVDMAKLYADDPLAALLLEGSIPDNDNEDEYEDDLEREEQENNDIKSFNLRENQKRKNSINSLRHDLFNLESDLIQSQQSALDENILKDEFSEENGKSHKRLKKSNMHLQQQNAIKPIENKIQKLEKYLHRMKYLLEELDLVDND
jgi:hypothetical protein